MKITCTGPTRGDCGKIHHSIGAALECIERDQRGCAAHGGHSDRVPRGQDDEGRAEVF